MWTLLLFMVAIGLPALFHTGPVHGQGGRYSFAGVLHVEGTSNYSLTFQQALELCQSLNYKLATLEQVIEAYKNGLRTCRYGWIDGKVVAFLPHINGPNCDSSSTDVTVHSEAATYLSDVYCFNPSVEKTNEDVLEEALIEGFLVELEKKNRNAAKETMPASEEPVAKTDLEDTTGSTNKFRFRRSSVVPVVFPEEEGSGSGLDPEPQFTTTLPTIETTATTTIKEEVPKEVPVVPVLKNNSSLHAENGGRKINFEDLSKIDLPSTPSGHQGKRTPAWLVIVATCVVVGAILCIFAAIATKDKWYGPRRSKNITPENYSKSATLPLSEKEKEIVTLMNIAILDNDKTQDIKASLEEHEKEYLM